MGLGQGKNLLPFGGKFFPFRVDPFSEGAWCAGIQTESYKSYLPCQKWGKFYQMLQKLSPLSKMGKILPSVSSPFSYNTYTTTSL